MRNNYTLAFIIIFGAVVVLMIMPYMQALISAFVLTFLLLPVHRFISKKIPKPISALFVVFFMIGALFVLLYWIISTAISQAQIYMSRENTASFLTTILSNIPTIPPEFSKYVQDLTSEARQAAIDAVISIVSNVTTITIGIIITLFVSYYLFISWSSVSKYIMEVIPFQNKARVMSRIGNSARKIIYGYSIIGLIDFAIAFVIFKITGIQLALFFAILIGLSAFIPFIGPIAIWFPIMLVQFLQLNYVAAIIILVGGLAMTILIDHILSNILVGRQSQVNPAIMMLGVFGGIGLFGPLGFIVGPLVLISFIEFLGELSKQE